MRAAIGMETREANYMRLAGAHMIHTWAKYVSAE